jgi:PPOX class probable F420-dependent enzyme
MHEAKMRELVATAPVGRMATIGRDGRPHLVPICFALAGDVLYSAVDEKPKRSRRLQRLENVREHPEVAVLIDHYEDDWMRLWWVRLRGTGRVVERGPGFEAALRLLSAKYEQYREQPPGGPVLAITIDEWRGWSAEGVACDARFQDRGLCP